MADHGLDFELPFASKFLLLAAYVCSRNKPALDRRLFDPSMRGGRRRGAMASDKQVTQPSSSQAHCLIQSSRGSPMSTLHTVLKLSLHMQKFWCCHTSIGVHTHSAVHAPPLAFKQS